MAVSDKMEKKKRLRKKDLKYFTEVFEMKMKVLVYLCSIFQYFQILVHQQFRR